MSSTPSSLGPELDTPFWRETFALHRGGKLAVVSRVPLEDRADLAKAYTPGVAAVCAAIHEDAELSFEYTGRANTVAVVSDGSAVLGLGRIGPEASMPVLEGKAVLFKKFGGVDAIPIALDLPGVDRVREFVEAVVAIAPSFGGINLEDVAAPECFEIERQLAERLDIPVFHDDQHGTAVVVLAGLLNACRATGRALEDLRVVVLGAGAAGVACTKILLAAGVGDIAVVDSRGVIGSERADGLTGTKLWLAQNTNRAGITGGVREALRGADVFLGVSGPRLVEPEWLGEMADPAIVFALANPDPEVDVDAAPANVRVVATGRSSDLNQVNNVLAFPGIFRGLLDARAPRVDDDAKIAAARGIASLVSDEEIAEGRVIPSPFNPAVATTVAAAVTAHLGLLAPS
ncbi:MAG: NADP-dependent malic enzyme [Actinomycetota bacterium]|nr:NADP-dependent malic enzyme [Actinomycetota bacterium]